MGPWWRLPRGESPDPRPLIAGDHERRVFRPGERATPADTLWWAEPQWIGQPDPHRVGRDSHAAGPDADRSGRDAYAAGAHAVTDPDPAHATSAVLARRLKRSGRAAHSSETSCRMVPASRSSAWRWGKIPTSWQDCLSSLCMEASPVSEVMKRRCARATW